LQFCTPVAGPGKNARITLLLFDFLGGVFWILHNDPQRLIRLDEISFTEHRPAILCDLVVIFPLAFPDDQRVLQEAAHGAHPHASPVNNTRDSHSSAQIGAVIFDIVEC